MSEAWLVHYSSNSGFIHRGTFEEACMRVYCRQCQASVGQQCYTPSGKDTKPHAARRYRVHKAPKGLL